MPQVHAQNTQNNSVRVTMYQLNINVFFPYNFAYFHINVGIKISLINLPNSLYTKSHTLKYTYIVPNTMKVSEKNIFSFNLYSFFPFMTKSKSI